MTFTKLTPQPGDGLNILEAKILQVLKNQGGGGGGGAGATQVYYGTTALRNATTPTTTLPGSAIWILTDSAPPGQISEWNGAAWI